MVDTCLISDGSTGNLNYPFIRTDFHGKFVSEN